ncbi:hypothetical protein Q1695_015965 [Nippostrongylus brasiliensis]|nr:hypothetical protein Q1695_015965 [Nippostrongylus brasiliensis]
MIWSSRTNHFFTEEPEVEIPEIPAPRGGERSEFSCLLLDDDQRYSEVSAEALLAPSTAEYNRRRPNLRKRPRIQYVDLDEDDEDNGSMSGDVLERPETREAHEVYYGNYAAHEEDASTSALRRRLLLKEIELADLRIEREKKMIQLVDKQLAEELAKRINPSVQSMNSNFQQRQTPTPEMTSNAVINAHCFEDDTKNPTMRHTPEDTCGSCCTSCAEANSRKLDGILEKLKHVESSSSAKSAETGFCFEKIMSELEETNNVLRSVYSKIPKPTTEGPNFALMPKEKVATMRKLRGDNMNKFALDLERELYATGDRKDLTKPVEKRFASADKVAFIKECVFMFYDVHGEAKRTTWLAVRNALNSRVRRLRSSSKGMSVDCPLLESFNYDTDEQKWSDLTQ